MDIGSNKDRHENINEGYIGNVGFKNLLHNKFFRELSFILEVPGFQNKSRKSKGPDIENVERLKSLLK